MSTTAIEARLNDLALEILATSDSDQYYMDLCCEFDALSDMLNEGFADA